jgi:hypothetical protein
MIVRQTFRENNIIYLTGQNYIGFNQKRTQELINSGFILGDIKIEPISEPIIDEVNQIIIDKVEEVVVDKVEDNNKKKQSWKSKK